MVQREGSQASVHLDETLYGGAPGQSAVVYEGDTVVGGGFIAAGEG
jgi:tRNA U34 2-thiouridine synthase MnmA/TrmU